MMVSLPSSIRRLSQFVPTAACTIKLALNSRCRLLDKADLDEHRHLVDDESAPEGVLIQIVRVGEESLGRDILQASCMEVANKIAANEVIIDCFPEDAVERIHVKSRGG